MTASSVYVVTPWHGTFAGGAGLALASIASALVRCRQSVTVLTTCSKSPYEDWRASCFEPGEYIVDGIRTLRFGVDRSDPTAYHLAVRTRLEGKVPSEALQEAFFERGLNSQDLIDFVGTLPAEATVLAGPYFQSLIPSLVNRHPGRVSVLPAFHDEPELSWRPIGRMVSNAKCFLLLTDDEKALAIRVHGMAGGRVLAESPVVGLGVELPPALLRCSELLKARDAAARKFLLPANYFLYVGRIEAAKGLSYLVPWFSTWASRREAAGLAKVPLVFIGAGDASLIPDTDAFMKIGFVTAEEKFALMAGGQSLINPSRHESFSYVIMESWLCARPVIVPADCVVTAAHCRRSGGGLTFSGEDQFYGALDAALDRQTSESLGAAGHRYVRANYSWPEVMDRIMRALSLQ